MVLAVVAVMVMLAMFFTVVCGVGVEVVGGRVVVVVVVAVGVSREGGLR